MQVIEDLRIGDCQSVSHIYHDNAVGLDLAVFDMTQAELDKLRGRFINYTRKRYKLPSINHIRAYKTSLKTICLLYTTMYYTIIKMIWRKQLFIRMISCLL